MNIQSMLPWLIPILASVGVAGLAAIVGKLMPRDKFDGIMIGLAPATVQVLTLWLLRFLPKKAEEEVEEAILVTLFHGVQMYCQKCIELLRADNAAKP